jgi:pimeloyl-ACP methyl ester carboxylesterase
VRGVAPEADGGVILHVVERGAGSPLVLLHGLFGRAGNFGTVQRALAAKFRVLALDLRNHGESPHAAAMSYAAMADDVLETLRHRVALPCALVGHSMGGKVAMTVALRTPDAVSRLVVADIAPVPYAHSNRAYAEAMAAVPLHAGLTRAAADAALADAVPDPAVRGFLLQNLRFSAAPEWLLGLKETAAAMPQIEDWPQLEDEPYPGPVLFVAGARSDYILPESRPAIRALFPGARFVTLKQAGHWVHADNPAGFVGVLEAFLG